MTGIGVMFIRGCIPTIDTIATIALALKLAAIFSRSPIPRVRTIPAIAFISCTAGGYPNHESARILAGPLKTRVVDNSIAPTYANAIRMGDSVPKSPRLPKISPGVFNLNKERDVPARYGLECCKVFIFPSDTSVLLCPRTRIIVRRRQREYSWRKPLL